MEDKKVDNKIEINQEPNKISEQFCSCCKPIDFFEFLNNKNKDMLCSDIFSYKLAPDSTQTKTHDIKKSNTIFIKKMDNK